MILFDFSINELKKNIAKKNIWIALVIQTILFYLIISNFFGSLPLLYERWYENKNPLIPHGIFFEYFCINLSNRVLFAITISICSLTFLVDEFEKENICVRNFFFVPPHYYCYFLSKYIISNFLISIQFFIYAIVFYFLYNDDIAPYIKSELKVLPFLEIVTNFFFYYIKTFSVSALILTLSFFLKRKQFYTMLIGLIMTYVMSLVKFSPSHSLFDFKMFLADEITMSEGFIMCLWIFLSVVISRKILSSQL
jgi:hypothetical protein